MWNAIKETARLLWHQVCSRATKFRFSIIAAFRGDGKAAICAAIDIVDLPLSVVTLPVQFAVGTVCRHYLVDLGMPVGYPLAVAIDFAPKGAAAVILAGPIALLFPTAAVLPIFWTIKFVGVYYLAKAAQYMTQALVTAFQQRVF